MIVERAVADRGDLGRLRRAGTPVGMTCSSTSTCSHAGHGSTHSRRWRPAAAGTGASRTRSAPRGSPVGSTSVVRPSPRSSRRASTATRCGNGNARSRSVSRAVVEGRAQAAGFEVHDLERRRAQVAVDRQAVVVDLQIEAVEIDVSPGRFVLPGCRGGCPTGARAGSRSTVPRAELRERARPGDVLLAAETQRRAQHAARGQERRFVSAGAQRDGRLALPRRAGRRRSPIRAALLVRLVAALRGLLPSP